MLFRNSKLEMQVNAKLKMNTEITDIFLNLEKDDRIEDILEDIKQFPKLTTLKLYCTEQGDKINLNLEEIENLKQIKILELTGFENIIHTEILKQCNSLSKLYVSFRSVENYDFIRDLYLNILHRKNIGKAKLKIRIKQTKENKETIDFFNLEQERGIYLNIETIEDTQTILENLISIPSIAELINYNKEALLIELMENSFFDIKETLHAKLEMLQITDKINFYFENQLYSYDDYQDLKMKMKKIIEQMKPEWNILEKIRAIYEIVLQQENPFYKNLLKTFQLLINQLEIPCEMIASQYVLESNTYYTYLQIGINYKWYNIDIAWDKERILQGKNIKYFLNSDKDFIKDLDIYTRKQHLPQNIENAHICYDSISVENLIKIEKNIGITRKTKVVLWFEKWKRKIEKLLPIKEKRLRLPPPKNTELFTK